MLFLQLFALASALFNQTLALRIGNDHNVSIKPHKRALLQDLVRKHSQP
jgi:hypothetical protein